jgi:hypothetical protein
MTSVPHTTILFRPAAIITVSARNISPLDGQTHRRKQVRKCIKDFSVLDCPNPRLAECGSFPVVQLADASRQFFHETFALGFYLNSFLPDQLTHARLPIPLPTRVRRKHHSMNQLADRFSPDNGWGLYQHKIVKAPSGQSGDLALVFTPRSVIRMALIFSSRRYMEGA